MQLSDFNFELPTDLIAQTPLMQRGDSKLLVLEPSEKLPIHSVFNKLHHWLCPNDLLIFNDTKVIKARLFAQKQTGGKVELLIERVTNKHEALAMIRGSSSLKSGQTLRLTSQINSEKITYTVLLVERKDQFWHIKTEQSVLELLEEFGEVPLPPYIQRSAEVEDEQRYQTVFAKNPGAVAAPTAGLHFSESYLTQLREQGIQTGYITLHVGAGTFLPVQTENIENHVMHKEQFYISADLIEKIRETKAAGRRVIAVGTTVVRALESTVAQFPSAFLENTFTSDIASESQLFIRPGYSFKLIDGLITNFHLPKSTLLMMISAFAGYERIRQAYQIAIENEYRFFSYGDAMLIFPEEYTRSE
ncbi:MAG: tRNA preQ1(34) S-adenosylmethionine ribosyltransferase-isomerase QueA [Pseudomonadota bacterium]